MSETHAMQPTRPSAETSRAPEAEPCGGSSQQTRIPPGSTPIACGRFTLWCPSPDPPPKFTCDYIDCDGKLERAMIAFSDGGNREYTIVISGPSGSGKTEMAMALARAMKLPVYSFQGTPETTPQALTVKGVQRDGRSIDYVAGRPAAGFIRGGMVILDEAGKIAKDASDALAALAPATDSRRWLHLEAIETMMSVHDDAAMVITKQDNEPLPDFIRNRALLLRLTPRPPEVLVEILRRQVSHAPSLLLDAFRDFAAATPNISTREAVLTLKWATKLAAHMVPGRLTADEADRLIQDAASAAIWEEAF